jgi:Heterokaryon incompatibility protein (HET)
MQKRYSTDNSGHHGSFGSTWYPLPMVDCLCIVQDDAESKHNQNRAMAGVYANAYVTIIAGNGWDANHGLRGIQGVTEPRHLSRFSKADVEENLQPYTSIWYSRGWTFQEMVFSPRKIMFQYQMSTWECSCNSCHESSSQVMTDLDISAFQPGINPWRTQIRFLEWPDIKQYVALVNDYNLRKLTYPEDGLTAISSLLSIMSSSFQGGFISGLPQMFFDEALLWQPLQPMQRRKFSNTPESPLPSWSWVGWEGEIASKSWIGYYSHLMNISAKHTESRLLQVQPLVRWYYGGSLSKDGEKIPINNSGHAFVQNRTFPQRLPPGWTYDRESQAYLYQEQAATKSFYPIPIVYDNQPQPLITARYLSVGLDEPSLIGPPQVSAELHIASAYVSVTTPKIAWAI